jgi:hypothetical protein
VLNATTSETLLSAIKARGLAGVALSVVYAEYEGAYEHVHSYPESAVHRSPTHVWHANVAPPPVQGALARWRACGGGGNMKLRKIRVPACDRKAPNKSDTRKQQLARAKVRMHVDSGGLVHAIKQESKHGKRISAHAKLMKPRSRSNRRDVAGSVKLTL